MISGPLLQSRARVPRKMRTTRMKTTRRRRKAMGSSMGCSRSRWRKESRCRWDQARMER
jgi:hypothetical protein